MSNADLVFIPEPSTITLCRGCRQRIFFVSTGRKDQRMPVTAQADPNGNLSITAGARGHLPTAVVLNRQQAAGAREAGMKLYASHFQSCPSADEFRTRARTRGSRR